MESDSLVGLSSWGKCLILPALFSINFSNGSFPSARLLPHDLFAGRRLGSSCSSKAGDAGGMAVKMRSINWKHIKMLAAIGCDRIGAATSRQEPRVHIIAMSRSTLQDGPPVNFSADQRGHCSPARARRGHLMRQSSAPNPMHDGANTAWRIHCFFGCPKERDVPPISPDPDFPPISFPRISVFARFLCPMASRPITWKLPPISTGVSLDNLATLNPQIWAGCGKASNCSIEDWVHGRMELSRYRVVRFSR